MRYFTNIAERAFMTSADGQRLFNLNGPWSRPFIIPDADTEKRLYKKQVWLPWVLIGSVILVSWLLVFFFPKAILHPYWSLAFLGVTIAVFKAVNWIVLAPDLKGLQRLPKRLSFREFHQLTTQRDSKFSMAFGLACSLALVAAGIWMLLKGINLAIAIITIAFFGFCTVSWGYTLWLKTKGTQ